MVAKTRKSKERATWAFFVTAPGEKDTPIVVGRSFNPRCFKLLKNNTRLCKCDYFSSGRAWMASEIFVKVSFEVDREGRHILLFPDNAPCHPNQLIDCFWNMKMAFLSKKTTSPTQPLDAGIIKLWKVKRKGKLMSAARSTDIKQRVKLSSLSECANSYTMGANKPGIQSVAGYCQ